MIRAVLDTNVLVSSILSPGAVPGRIVRAWEAHAFELCPSDLLFLEVVEVMRRPHIQKMAKFGAGQIEELLELLLRISTIVPGPLNVEPVVADDPDDDMVLATAVAGRADVIVSGDRHLLVIREHRSISIVTPRQFLDLLEAEPA
jgi:putative PIN family toxin of toxin-antitoxin system